MRFFALLFLVGVSCTGTRPDSPDPLPSTASGDGSAGSSDGAAAEDAGSDAATNTDGDVAKSDAAAGDAAPLTGALGSPCSSGTSCGSGICENDNQACVKMSGFLMCPNYRCGVEVTFNSSSVSGRGKPRLADVDEDGNLDLILLRGLATTPPTADINVRLGNGDGTFGDVAYTTGPHDLDGAMTLADLDGDGHLDIATADGTVFRGNGNGTFGAPDVSAHHGCALCGAIGAADFNGDGALDLAAGSSTRLLFYLNDGTGHFAPRVEYDFQTATTSSAGEIAIADVNLDGHLDVLVAAADVVGFLGDGKGSFVVGLESPINHSHSVTVADFDRNGSPDVLGEADTGTAMIDLDEYMSPVILTRKEHFMSHSPVADSMLIVSSVGAADLNGDAIPDMFSFEFQTGALVVAAGFGDATFQRARTFPRAIGASSLFGDLTSAVGDLNNDGKLDIVHNCNGETDIFLNTTN